MLQARSMVPIYANNVRGALKRAQKVPKLPCTLKSSLKYIKVIGSIDSGSFFI
jgi:hypothetical protein